MDAIYWEVFDPCSRVYHLVKGEILNDEGVIISFARVACNTEVFEPHSGVAIPRVFDEVRRRVEPHRERSMGDPLREGSCPIGVRARAASSVPVVLRTFGGAGLTGGSSWPIMAYQSKFAVLIVRRQGNMAVATKAATCGRNLVPTSHFIPDRMGSCFYMVLA